jgi:hypothetical protein
VKPKQNTKYLVEVETGIGFKGRDGKGYPVFTGHRWCANKREALDVVERLRKDKPTFHVRITKKIEIIGIVAEWQPFSSTNPSDMICPVCNKPIRKRDKMVSTGYINYHAKCCAALPSNTVLDGSARPQQGGGGSGTGRQGGGGDVNNPLT